MDLGCSGGWHNSSHRSKRKSTTITNSTPWRFVEDIVQDGGKDEDEEWERKMEKMRK